MRRWIHAGIVAWLVACALGCGAATTTDGQVAVACKLLGTWEEDYALDPKFARIAERRGIDAKAVLEESGELPLRFTFDNAGSYTMEGSVLGHPIHEVNSWSVVEESANQVTITVQDEGKPPEPMTFVFVEPDVISVKFMKHMVPTFLRRVE